MATPPLRRGASCWRVDGDDVKESSAEWRLEVETETQHHRVVEVIFGRKIGLGVDNLAVEDVADLEVAMKTGLRFPLDAKVGADVVVVDVVLGASGGAVLRTADGPGAAAVLAG